MYHAPKVSIYAEEADGSYTPLARRVTVAEGYAEVAHDLRHFETVLGPVRSLHTPHVLAPAAAALVVVYADYVDPHDPDALLDRIAFCDCPAHREKQQAWADRAARITAGRPYRAASWIAGAVDGIRDDLSALRLRIARLRSSDKTMLAWAGIAAVATAEWWRLWQVLPHTRAVLLAGGAVYFVGLLAAAFALKAVFSAPCLPDPPEVIILPADSSLATRREVR